jgi:hypothetical protein
MKRSIWFPGLILGLAVLSVAGMSAQSTPPTIYAESFRKGPTRITEANAEVKLTPETATYRERIKDSHGSDRYELTISPQGPEGDTKIGSWRVSVRDLHHIIYSNILLADQEGSADPENDLGWLNPDRYSRIPVKAKRIMKVDGFYVAVQVKELHFSQPDSPYLDSMTVQVGFTNDDPRAARP